MATSAKVRPMKERFDAAVELIRTAPSDGDFQPSNTTKLRFYALFKQANIGPCNIPKPGFWDTVGRAKWEAWSVCGEMSKDLAMQMYVEETERQLKTMTQSEEIQRSLRAIGPHNEQNDAVKTEPLVENGDLSLEEPDNLTNQNADDSDAESESSMDFKDSFQELETDALKRPTQSSPGDRHKPSDGPDGKSPSRGPRPSRTVTFAEPVTMPSTGLPVGRFPAARPLQAGSVTMELSRLQTSIQAVLQQLNSLSLAVGGLSRALASGSDADHEVLMDPQQLVPRLVTRRGRVLSAFLRATPLLITWPIIVGLFMNLITKRLSTGGSLPGWVWFILSFLQGVFTVLMASRVFK